jgi:Fic-DOC domain mobile mystery protein B
MMIMKFNYPIGATPLDAEELRDLIPQHITTQAELNAWEEKNILTAEQWALKQEDIVTMAFIKELHKHMFNMTWKWAGKFRTSEKNIGIDWHKIPIMVRELCDNVRYQLDHDTYSSDEIVVRFHHRLVWIHCFSNGNGRHARLIADLLIIQQGKPRFSWGRFQSLYEATSVRAQYIESLRLADKGDYSQLLAFARS